MKKILKSIGAVIAGFIAVAFLSVATDAVLESMGVLPSPTDLGAYVTWMLALALFYRSIYTAAGGYITAKLAPQNPMNHVYALMILGGVSGTLAAIFGWSFGHHWYTISLAITGPLFVWLGGKLKTK